MPDEEKGFVIKDRRAFSPETGEPVEDKKEKAETEETSRKASSIPEADSVKDQEAQLPEVNLATFIFSISSSALLSFGEIPDPETGAKSKNLPMAKHSIDILSMLEEKTRGNRTDDEEQLITNILYDLRMRYIKETK